MKFLKFFLGISLSLYVMSCSGGDDFTTTTMTLADARWPVIRDSLVIGAYVTDSIVVTSVSVYEVDDSLNEIRKVFSKEGTHACYQQCITDSVHMRTGYMKIALEAESRDSTKTKISLHSYFDGKEDHIAGTRVYSALMTKRVERLVREEGLPLNIALNVAEKQMPPFFNYESFSTGCPGDKFMKLLLKMDEDGESFYRAFEGLSNKLAERSFYGDRSFEIHLADSLLSLYEQGAWNVQEQFDKVQCFAYFWQKAYDFSGCGNPGDKLWNKTDGKYAHRAFACNVDKIYFPNYAYEYFHYWLPVDESEGEE